MRKKSHVYLFYILYYNKNLFCLNHFHVHRGCLSEAVRGLQLLWTPLGVTWGWLRRRRWLFRKDCFQSAGPHHPYTVTHCGRHLSVLTHTAYIGYKACRCDIINAFIFLYFLFILMNLSWISLYCQSDCVLQEIHFNTLHLFHEKRKAFLILLMCSMTGWTAE